VRWARVYSNAVMKVIASAVTRPHTECSDLYRRQHVDKFILLVLSPHCIQPMKSCITAY